MGWGGVGGLVWLSNPSSLKGAVTLARHKENMCDMFPYWFESTGSQSGRWFMCLLKLHLSSHLSVGEETHPDSASHFSLHQGGSKYFTSWKRSRPHLALSQAELLMFYAVLMAHRR